MIRYTLIVLELLAGISAVGGGIYALAGGKDDPPGLLRLSPFRTGLVPGLVLLVVVGGSMLGAASLLLAGGSAARLVSLEAGVILLGLTVAKASVTGYRSRLQPLSFVMALAVVVLSVLMHGPG